MYIKTVAEPRAGNNTAPRPGRLAEGAYSLLLVVIEVLVQTVAFSIIYFNMGKQFPFSTATIVFLTELTTFVLFYIAFCPQQKRMCFWPSLVYLIPAFFFVTASNAFYYCLCYIPPPTWNIFVQSRPLFSALGGYIVYGRPIGREKWLSILPLTLAAGLAVYFCPEVQMHEIHGQKEKKNDSTEYFRWVAAALCGVTCSVFAVNSTEFISKLGSRPAAEKHIQLHFLCAVLSITWAEFVTNGDLFELTLKILFPLDFYLCLLNLILGTLGGLAATFITVNRLSNLADDPSAIPAWITPILFLASTLVGLLIFPTQRYPYLVTAAIALLMGVTSYLYSTSSSSVTEENRAGTRQEA